MQIAGSRRAQVALAALAAAAAALPPFAGRAEAREAIPITVAPEGAPAADEPDPRASTRIVGGGPTTIHAQPHQVALVFDGTRFTGNDFQRQFCGGILITPRIVQTAAHCIVGHDPDCGNLCLPGEALETNDLDVVAGRTVLSGGGGQRLDVIGGAVDSDYNASTNDFDAAWVVLGAAPSSPAAPIQIAGPGEAPLWAPGRPTVVSGWGAISDGGPGSDTLKAATVPIIPDATCAALPGQYALQFNPAAMVCAGVLAGGTDSCQGDSGGPLVAPGFIGTAPVRRLVGVVSWGTGCADPNAPGVYTRIAGADYNPFVQNIVDGLEADTNLTQPGGQTLPDAGPVYGAGAVPDPPATKPATKKKCKKGKRLKKGKCVKKKRKKKGKKRRR
jgi:trypsin